MKIKILVIDDRPLGLFRGECDSPFDPLGENDLHLSDHFDAKWISTLEECREYIDSHWELARKFPTELGGERGWIPDIIIFDYSMTGDTRTLQQRNLSRHSPLNILRSLTASHGITIAASGQAPSCGRGSPFDTNGCYAGGIAYLLMQDHPCGVCPFTMQDNDEAKDADLFEWLLTNIGHNQFRNKKGKEYNWYKLIASSIPTLRSQISHLIFSEQVHFSLEQVGNLCRKNFGEEILTIYDRYGQHDYPLDALFIDIQSSYRHDFITWWARKLMTCLFEKLKGSRVETTPINLEPSAEEEGGLVRQIEATVPDPLTEFRTAEEIVNSLWRFYQTKPTDLPPTLQKLGCSEIPLLRFRINNYLQRDYDPEEREIFDALMEYFGIEDQPKKKGEHNWVCTASHRVYGFDSCDNYLPQARRWAALLMIIKLLELRQEGIRYIETLDPEIQSSPTIVHARTALNSPITKNELLMALFPSQEAAVFTKSDLSSRNITRHLTDLGEKVNGVPSLSLKLEHLFKPPYDWDPANERFGLKPVERYLLQCLLKSRKIAVKLIPDCLKSGQYR